MSIFTNAGRAVLADLVASRPLHLALGDGGDEQILPQPDYDAKSLIGEIGRKAVARVLFVVPDDNGVLILPGDKRYAMSESPTRHLYLDFAFDYDDGVGGQVREIGVFVDTKAVDGMENKSFLLPDEIEERGELLLLEHLEDPDTYNPRKKGSYEIVLSF